MPQANSSHSSLDQLASTAFRGAERFFSADIQPLSGSGVGGRIMAAYDEDANKLTVVVVADGLEADMPHVQHIHGFLDGTEATIPTLEDDADGDGFIELLEGVPDYGPILLDLTDQHDGGAGGSNGHSHEGGFAGFPTAPDGMVRFVSTYDLPRQDLPADPALLLRHYVIHGMTVGAVGVDAPDVADEVDGTPGYKAVLPVGIAEFEAISRDEAFRELAEISMASQSDFDVVVVSDDDGGQTRATFVSAQVGNGDPNDMAGPAPQDGGLAVRLQEEDADGNPSGDVTRYEDEGVVFVAAPGVTFDVRDLVSGAQRGDQFEVVVLGTQGDDILFAVAPERPYYWNGGMGNDAINGGNANDFLVGGAGDDVLEGAGGNDNFIGGGGTDRFAFGADDETGQDLIIDFQRQDLFVLSEALPDGNRDGIITFGANGVLDLDGADAGEDTVQFTGLDGRQGLRFVGEQDGAFFYADARTRPDGAREGRLGDDTLRGDAGDDRADVFFFDTRLDLDLGDDRIQRFGEQDILVTTTAIFDSNSNEVIGFGANERLDLSGDAAGSSPGDAGSVRITSMSGRTVTALEFDGAVVRGDTTYYVYSLVGSSAGTGDLMLG